MCFVDVLVFEYLYDLHMHTRILIHVQGCYVCMLYMQYVGQIGVGQNSCSPLLLIGECGVDFFCKSVDVGLHCKSCVNYNAKE